MGGECRNPKGCAAAKMCLAHLDDVELPMPEIESDGLKTMVRVSSQSANSLQELLEKAALWQEVVARLAMEGIVVSGADDVLDRIIPPKRRQ